MSRRLPTLCLLALTTSWALVGPVRHQTLPSRMPKAPRCCAADVEDHDAADHGATEFKGFGSPRGFGATLDSVDEWIEEMEAEDAADGVILPAALKAKRNRILLNWADFVKTAGDRLAGAAPVVAELREVSMALDDARVLDRVSWAVR
jgi:hypothetical protein